MQDQTYLERLTREQCLELLQTVPVGWLAYCHAGRPQLVPVNFALDQDEVLVRTGYGDKLAAAAHQVEMSFAVSSIDPGTRTGWSVTVGGPGRLLDDGVDLANPALAALTAWAPGDREFYVGIVVADVSGRRIRAVG